MDFQFWIWLAIVVISLIAQARKKKKQPSEAVPLPNDPSPTDEIDTFEELLREIEDSKGKPYNAHPLVEEKKEDHEALEKENRDKKTLRDAYDNYNKETIYEEEELPVFELKTEKPAKSSKKPAFRSSSPIGKDNSNKKHTSFDWSKELKTKGGLKKAFVMSEILSRRY